MPCHTRSSRSGNSLNLTSSCLAIVLVLYLRAKCTGGQHPSPDSKPREKLFVTVSLRPHVLQQACVSKLAYHPGLQRTLASQRFLWPYMLKDVLQFVATCPNCTQGDVIPPSSSGTTTTAAHSTLTLVTHSPGLHHWSLGL